MFGIIDVVIAEKCHDFWFSFKDADCGEASEEMNNYHFTFVSGVKSWSLGVGYVMVCMHFLVNESSDNRFFDISPCLLSTFTSLLLAETII